MYNILITHVNKKVYSKPLYYLLFIVRINDLNLCNNIMKLNTDVSLKIPMNKFQEIYYLPWLKV